MTNHEDGAWRDERKLPMSELLQAMATYSQDGQVDDLTGSDAGAEAGFGHATPEERAAGDDGASVDERAPSGDADPTSADGRRLRPSPDGTSADGRSGPN
jgi:hypothetical protein